MAVKLEDLFALYHIMLAYAGSPKIWSLGPSIFRLRRPPKRLLQMG